VTWDSPTERKKKKNHNSRPNNLSLNDKIEKKINLKKRKVKKIS
jgi:hypothetical protein